MTDLPTVKLKSLVTFPANILDGTGIDVVKINGAYRFDLAFDDFAPPVAGIADPSHQNVLLWNSITGVYVLAPVTVVGAGGAVGEAPNDGVQYGRQSLTWTPVAAGGGGTPSNTNPLMDGIAAPGAATPYSRGDHVHPSDTTRQAADGDLTALAALAGTGVAHRTGANTWTVGDPVVNAELAGMAAFTLKGNKTGATATPADFDIPSLPAKVAPAGGDFLMVSDQSASGALVKVAFSNLPGASGGIGEAPNDGIQYGRQSLGWTAITGGGVTPSNALPLMDGAAAAGVSLLYSRGDHVHPTDTSRAPLASPTFTGDPKAPTPAPGDNDTSLATTAFVTAAVAAGGGGVSPSNANPLIDAAAAAPGVSALYSRGDHVHPMDAFLLSIALLGTAADRIIYTTGVDVAAEAPLTPFARTFLDDANAAAVQTTLGLGTAAVKNTGTSGNNVPLLDGDNTWTGIQGYNETALTYVASGTTAWDVDAAPVATAAMATGNTTMGAPTNVVAGRVYTIRFTQDTSPRTVAWTAANYKFNGGTPAGLPVISTGSGAIDRLTFIGRAGNVLEEIGRSQGIA